MYMKTVARLILCYCIALLWQNCGGQVLHHNAQFTRQDTLRGSITPGRAWWDVTYYGVTVQPDFNTKSIKGLNNIHFTVLEAGSTMQLDLQLPMEITSVLWNNSQLKYTRDSNIYLIHFPEPLQKNSLQQLVVSFQGTPREAVRPPWDGGWIWKRDSKGRPWMSVACQGLGASVWYPCKDHQSDEPDSASLTIVVPDSLTGVGNGRLRAVSKNNDGTTVYTWVVKNPINNYSLIPYIGKYVNWSETITGEKGNLDCSYWVLDYHLKQGKAQFQQVPPMIKCFEEWFGPYPFYEDSYKLVESPHLGMEHQSAIAYGNGFKNGYSGRDLSGSGWGLKWDFIIIHESAHEWFGNNITSKDIADMWIHESFANYAEIIFTGCQFGKEAGTDYVIGIRKAIVNDIPVTGPYGVNHEGSGDMYYKGANMIHTIRQVINNDSTFKAILRGMNKTFYHQTVTARQVEDYISKQSHIDCSKIFDQYLLHTEIPVLEYSITGNEIFYRWVNCIDGFNLPVKINEGVWIKPTTKWSSVNIPGIQEVIVDKNFYMQVRKAAEKPRQ